MTRAELQRTRPAPGTLEALHAERDFLLRSLDDLDDERAAGEITDRRYAELHDDYTVQTATVLRAISRLEGTEPSDDHDDAPSRSRRRDAIAVVAILTFAVGGTVLLVRSLADRGPGQTITGNAQSAAPTLDSLARDAASRPDDYDAQLVYATALMDAGQAVDAIRAFDAAARIDPTAPAPPAYSGWLVYLAGLTDEGLLRIDAAIAADPTYPDARFFRGMVLLRGRDDVDEAITEFRRFLDLAEPGPARDQVEQLLDELEVSTTQP